MSIDKTRERLERWRRQHGGPGKRIPEELWAEAIGVARVEGVGATARTLRLDRAGLTARMGLGPAAAASAADADASAGFVELDTGRLCPAPRTVVRLEGRDGERLEVELGEAGIAIVVALAEAFWGRQR